MLNLYEKYKVQSFDDFDKDIKERYKNVINILKSLSKENLPNILLYGGSGSAKRSLLYSFFDNVKKTKHIDTYKTSSNKPFNFIIYKSKDYIELDINELGIYKKYILRDIIKNFILTKKVINNKNKIIIIHNIHLLNVDDQFILRKIIEEYIVNCRFILLSNTINNLLEPIKSRCLILKTPGFTKKNVENKLKYIIKTEDLNIKKKILQEILSNANTNLKKAIMELNTYINMTVVNADKDYLTIKSESINNIIVKLIKCFKNKEINYEEVDKILYRLLINYKIGATIIIKKIYDNIIEKLNDSQQQRVVDLNYQYNIYLMNASKNIIYLQSYVYNLHEIMQKKK